ncbi:bone morphogenetic protein 2-like [Physella acuta]|uniref:bone morphogenetic protein 2-like n=1 Tax=Physella acuta TaxID=109671 RepID=UPI0027DE2204|nr:bone morphogenetic protein 2-like [Physella acuta]
MGLIACRTRTFWNFLRLLLALQLWLTLCSAAPGRSMDGPWTGRTMASTESEESIARPDVLAKLIKVFGFSRIPKHLSHLTPPQYMQDLYSALTDTGGLTRSSGPYNSNVIRSFPDRDPIHRQHFQYNISYLEEGETIKQAEFRIFKMKTGLTYDQRIPHHLVIKVYQICDHVTAEKLDLLDAHRVSTHAHGWYVFNVTKAVLRWHLGTHTNLGLLVTTEASPGVTINSSAIRFAQRNEHHESKQPILVVYNDDGQRKHSTFISPSDEEYVQIKEDALSRQMHTNDSFKNSVRKLNERNRNVHRSNSSARSRRSTKHRDAARKKRTFTPQHFRPNRRSCSRYEMFVDFEEIGWSGWIISPNSYNAYHCAGECPFPLGQNQKPTNHATVQSIVHALGVVKDVGTPCCVPNKLYSISLLYFDDNENVILKQYDDMVVASCGCH